MRCGASSRSDTSGIGFDANAAKSSTLSSRRSRSRGPSLRGFGHGRREFGLSRAPASTRLPSGPGLAGCAMSHVFPSEDWAAAYKDAINDNPKYKEAGKEWTHGAVAMVVKADPTLGIDEDIGLWLDIDRGDCTDCQLMPRERGAERAVRHRRRLRPLEDGAQEGARSHQGHDAEQAQAHEGAHAHDREVREQLARARRDDRRRSTRSSATSEAPHFGIDRDQLHLER